MARVPFRVSARAARLIGRENVATAHGAVTELVKNAYDADAGACAVLFLPRWREAPTSFSAEEFGAVQAALPDADNLATEENNRWHVKPDLGLAERAALAGAIERILDLWIVDNGHGMSADIINERWMVIGTDAKEVDVRSGGGRVFTGAKGIGRFALDRLGRESDLFSGQASSEEIVHWFVDWADFEGTGKIVSDVEALLEMEKRPLAEVYKASGLSGLLPTERPRRDLRAASEPLSFDTGTAIRIGLLNDNWELADSLRLKESLASLLPPHERADFDVYVHDHRAPTEGGFIDNLPPDQFDYRLAANVRVDGTVSIKIERQEIEPARIRPSVFDAEAMKQPGYTQADFERGYYEYETDLRRLLKLGDKADVEPYRRVGAFDLTLYFFKLQNPTSDTLLRFPQKNFDVVRRRAWLKNSGGIRLYRDNIRVRPYGEPGSQSYDWLRLGERAARNPAAASRIGWNVPPQQLAGTLYITKEQNPLLDDQSNREGIRNEYVFAAFREIVVALIAAFEHDRAYILGQFNAAYDRDIPPPPDVADAIRLVKAYRRSSTAGGGKRAKPGDPEAAARLSSDFNIVGGALESEVEANRTLREDNQVLRGMATLGTVLVSFTHELKQIKADMEARGERLAKSVEAVVDPDRLAELPEPARPQRIIERMRRQDEKVSRWVDFALAAVSPAKRRRRVIDVEDYLDDLDDYWRDFLSARQIEFDVRDNPRSARAAEGKRGGSTDRQTSTSAALPILAHEIDLDSIFYNLINNSIEAFLKPSAMVERRITIRAAMVGNWVEIEYRDNGPGLSKDFNVASDIFLFGESSKKDDDLGDPGGTGIGMWLLRNVVDDYRGQTELRSNLGEPGFAIMIRLPIHRLGGENT